MDCKDLIERTKCPDSVRGCKYLAVYDYSCKKCREQAMKDCATAIKTLLAEREAAGNGKHAHVVVNWLGDCHCSNCGENIDNTSNYCNWCGGKLDEPEQHED